MEYHKSQQISFLEIADGSEEIEGEHCELNTSALTYGAINEIQIEIRQEAEGLLAKYPQIIFKDEKSVTKTYLVQCQIHMKHNKPIRLPRRNLAPEKRIWFENEIKELRKASIVRPSTSIHAATPGIVAKEEGTWRLAIDYRKI